MNVILQGVVGSQAYGLATPNSDIDKLGIFVEPTQSHFKLENFPQTITNASGDGSDHTLHEVGKFVRLAEQSNPSILELLWLEDYHIKTKFGMELVSIRTSFATRKRVRDAYFGYASQQLRRARVDKDPQKVAKNARHMARLLYQGFELYSTGELTLRLRHPEFIREFGEEFAQGKADAEKFVAHYERAFNMIESPLPEKPDRAVINHYLITVRRAFL